MKLSDSYLTLFLLNVDVLRPILSATGEREIYVN